MKFSKELAEFFGILTGDGYINQYIYPKRKVSVMEITGNKEKDFDYMKGHVCNLINGLFDISPKVYLREDQNTIRVIINSKEIFNKIKKIGFPSGNKGEISVPEWVMGDEILFRKFIRGFFDTDGYLSLKNKEGNKYPVIGLSSKSKTLLEQIKSFLDSLEISSYLGSNIGINSQRAKDGKKDYKIQISGVKNIKSFFKEIGSNNKRNLLKYGEWESRESNPAHLNLQSSALPLS
jgi:intein/homing endonuclease